MSQPEDISPVPASIEGLQQSHSKFSEWLSILSSTLNRNSVPGRQAADTTMNKSRPRISALQGNDQDALLVLLPLLVVLSTFLFLLLLFLVCILLLRKRRGILLRDSDGPIDMSREELIDGEGGFEGVESRWLESVDEEARRSYLRAKEFQIQCPPNSLPTDITLSQFLAIQEKGVSAWSFEPDYETSPNLLVHSRTELTFLPDPSSSSCVQSNLPLPKLNEVYYWEVKMFDLPASTNVSIGLATKPYPSFRLPGHSRYSVAYHTNGDKSHNYPFTQTTFGPTLKEGDVLGVGYRPRSGTVFYTRNGRKLEDAFVGLTKWNLFPTIGADGPCSIHVNLGQSGFVFIEANVKKWGLAPSVGTLAPPPAYGVERGSILLEAGGERRIPPPPADAPSSSESIIPGRRSHRSRRPKPFGGSSRVPPPHSSPLRGAAPPEHLAIPPAATSIDEEPATYSSPTDRQLDSERPGRSLPSMPPSPPSPSSRHSSRSSSRTTVRSRTRPQIPELRVSPPVTPESESPQQTPNPPTPGTSDIHLHDISATNTPPVDTHSNEARLGNNLAEPNSSNSTATQRAGVASSRTTDPGPSSSGPSESDNGGNAVSNLGVNTTEPPAYSPLDAFHYPEGVAVDLPAEVIASALDGPTISESQYEAQSSNGPSTPPQGQQRNASGQGRSLRRPRRV